jgi:hypothetical protein
MAKALTAISVEKLKPTSSRREVPDALMPVCISSSRRLVPSPGRSATATAAEPESLQSAAIRLLISARPGKVLARHFRPRRPARIQPDKSS